MGTHLPSQLLILVTELHASKDGITFMVMNHCLTIQSITRLHWGSETEKTLTTERNGVVYNLRSQYCGG